MPHPNHDSVPALSAQLHTLIQNGWEQEVLPQLPARAWQQARTLGAFVRGKNLRSPADLLRGLLAYVLCASSFRQLGAWAVLIGLANLSHVAWQQRLRHARDWLLWLLSELLAVPAAAAEGHQSRVILIDATRLKAPGGCGDDWRIHLGYELTAGRLLDVRVSDRHTAEGFTLFAVREADVLVADRGYCRRGQLAYVVGRGAHVVVRFSAQHMPLLDAQGRPFEVLSWLNACQTGQHSCPVAFEHQGQRSHGRLLACALPAEAAERARAKARRKASKKQSQIREETLVLCGWFLLFSSLPPQQWSDEQVLDLYRARWQIELFIKRLKQLLKLAQLRGQTALTNEATILTLLLAWALVQSEVRELHQQLRQDMPPWPAALATASAAPSPSPAPPLLAGSLSSWTLTALGVQTLRQQCSLFLRRYLTHRRRRPHQETSIRCSLLARLGAPPVFSSSLFSCSST